MQTYDLVKSALKDKNPTLYRSLAASRELHPYLSDLASEINSEIVTLTMEMSRKDRAKTTDPMEVASLLKGYESAAKEIVFAQMLEFPQDESPTS